MRLLKNDTHIHRRCGLPCERCWFFFCCSFRKTFRHFTGSIWWTWEKEQDKSVLPCRIRRARSSPLPLPSSPSSTPPPRGPRWMTCLSQARIRRYPCPSLLVTVISLKHAIRKETYHFLFHFILYRVLRTQLNDQRILPHFHEWMNVDSRALVRVVLFCFATDGWFDCSLTVWYKLAALNSILARQ